MSFLGHGLKGNGAVFEANITNLTVLATHSDTELDVLHINMLGSPLTRNMQN